MVAKRKRNVQGLHLRIKFLSQSIRRTIDKKTVDVFNMFNEELNAVKKELTNKSVPLHLAHPKFAGQAHWARHLKRRIERSMMVRSVGPVFHKAHLCPGFCG